jgi:hypothetical protein
MSKLKCQVCGSENSDSDFFCQHCGTEISLPAINRAAVPCADSSSPQATAPSSVRACPKCGTPNDAVFPLCMNCGFDWSAGPGAADRLLLVIGQETFECKDGDILGREGTVAQPFFSAIGTVSRKHVGLTHREGRWFLTVSPAVQNVTQLDGRDIPRAVEQWLSGEHVLRLSTQCEVRLKLAP